MAKGLIEFALVVVVTIFLCIVDSTHVYNDIAFLKHGWITTSNDI
jgi:hypothetical protein